MRKYIVIGILFFIVGGCATSIRDAYRIVGYGKSDEYYKGFMPGCDFGHFLGGDPYYRSDEDYSPFFSSKEFKAGWDDGREKCKAIEDKLKEEEKERENEYRLQQTIERAVGNQLEKKDKR